MRQELRIGIDLGGTKIAGLALDPNREIRAERRIPAPIGDYDATLDAICRLVCDLEQKVGACGSVGIGIDLGGTKIAGLALDPKGKIRAERRIPAPIGDYGATLDAICRLCAIWNRR